MTANTRLHWNPFRRHALGSTIEYSAPAPVSETEMKSKTQDPTVTRMPSWPDEAKTLKQHNWVVYLFILSDLILVLLPIYFVLLGIAVVTLNGKPVDGNAFASKVTSAIKLGPTLFPIMFAAISGRSMKMIARYLAEKGAKLSTLELLMASQSVWGTIESQFLMRRLTLVGVNLIFLWAMSPLGGQASLRLLDKSTSTAEVFTPLRYLSTGPGSTAWAMDGGTYVETDGSLTQVEPLYAAALLGSDQVKGGPEDTWGNVKIPYMEYNGTQSPFHGWTTVSTDRRRPEDYTSLVGIPVIGRPLDRDGSFNLETSQLTVQCEPFKKVAVENATDYKELERLVPGQIWQDITEDDSPWGDGVSGGRRATFFLQTDLPLNNGGFNDGGDGRFNSYTGFVNTSMAGRTFPKRKITYASRFGFGTSGNTTLSIANCSLGQIHTETVVNCTKDRCAAVKVRPSLLDLRDPQVTPFDHSLISNMALRAFPRTFGWSRGSSPTEQFLFNTTSFQLVSPRSTLGDNPGWVDMASLTPEVFARRLALLLNTYYQLTVAPNAYLGNLPQNNFTAFGLDTVPVKDADVYLPQNMTTSNTTYTDWAGIFGVKTNTAAMYFVGATTNATISKTHAIYVCNFAWLSLLFAAAAAIFLTGAASLVLKRRTLGPEMFGFVTSMTYENPFLNLPKGGSMLDAMERARLLKDVEVYIGDVRSNEEVGHIAFAAGKPSRKLERGRLYY